MTTLTGTTLSGAETHIDNRAIDELAQDLSRPPILPDSAGLRRGASRLQQDDRQKAGADRPLRWRG